MAGLTEQELYRKLSGLKMSELALKRYDYPHQDPNNPGLAMPFRNGQRRTLRYHFADRYNCVRCKKDYQVGSDGVPLSTEGICSFHPNRYTYYEAYTCCGRESGTAGCVSSRYHVHGGESEFENYKGFVETQPKPEMDPDGHGVFALDCEMCYTTYGLELTRVTVINHKFEVVYEKLVKPEHPILDPNTRYSGITLRELDRVSTSLKDVQHDLLGMFSDKTILVGHGLEHDLLALKLFHKNIVDTAQLHPHPRGLPYRLGLKKLVQDHLNYLIQVGRGHDSKEDAVAALRLVMKKAGIN